MSLNNADDFKFSEIEPKHLDLFKYFIVSDCRTHTFQHFPYSFTL